MPRIREENEFYEQFCKHSKLLHPELHQTKGNIWFRDTSLSGLKAMLSERNDPEQGALLYARNAWKAALHSWDSYRKTLPIPVKQSEPTGLFGEKINETKAYLRFVETECRWLNAEIKKLAAQETEQEKERKKARPFNGAIKFLGGRPAICDGRELVEKDGALFFKDEPKLSLEKYLSQCKEHKKDKAKAKEAKRKAELLAEAKQTFGQSATVEKKKRRKRL